MFFGQKNWAYGHPKKTWYIIKKVTYNFPQIVDFDFKQLKSLNNVS